MKTKRTNRGVTLVEIAIVLVIIGLLLGGVLKGQELINNAKVRAIADRQNSMKVAWFAFIDRYQGLPGDYVAAQQYIPGAINGNGDGTLSDTESPIALQHLTGAGYLRCPQCTAQTSELPSALNSLQNNYGGVMSIWSDASNYASQSSTAVSRPRLSVHTGPRIPSNIISEVDRKLDDGAANTGDVVFNQYDPIEAAGSGGEKAQLTCMTTDKTTQADPTALNTNEPVYWRHALAEPPVEQNCGASVNI